MSFSEGAGGAGAPALAVSVENWALGMLAALITSALAREPDRRRFGGERHRPDRPPRLAAVPISFAAAFKETLCCPCSKCCQMRRTNTSPCIGNKPEIRRGQAASAIAWSGHVLHEPCWPVGIIRAGAGWPPASELPWREKSNGAPVGPVEQQSRGNARKGRQPIRVNLGRRPPRSALVAGRPRRLERGQREGSCLQAGSCRLPSCWESQLRSMAVLPARLLASRA
jgi:hypothetical protein